MTCFPPPAPHTHSLCADFFLLQQSWPPFQLLMRRPACVCGCVEVETRSNKVTLLPPLNPLPYN